MGKNKTQITHRHYDEENDWGCANWLEYTIVVVFASILLLGSLGITLFWAIKYHGGFAWRDNYQKDKQFNLHPVLMVAGFITFSGFSVLLYRICRCCRRIYVKLLHTVFHVLAIPCVAIGFFAVLDTKNSMGVANFYSMHSWIGLVTMGLFAIQFIVGFFSFLVLLCCEGSTARFRASLVPLHASFGLTTFMLAIASCLTGLMGKAVKVPNYPMSLEEEGIVINSLSMVLVALGILITYAVRSPTLESESRSIIVTEPL